MTGDVRRAHWDGVHVAKDETAVSWFQTSPEPSRGLIRRLAPSRDAAVLDVGGGAARLVDALLDDGFSDVTVLDISAAALARAQARLGDRAGAAQWITGDATAWAPARAYDLWHDRAAFHFLTDARDRAAYLARLRRALRPGGHVVLAAFAPDGPERCSGLPVMRHDAASFSAELGPRFTLVETLRHEHATPWGAIQRFCFATFRREG